MRIGIIGYGRFGKLWAECLADSGQEVLVYEKRVKSKKLKVKSCEFVSLDKVVKVDFLFLLVPISEIENICREIARLLDKNTVVVDACSVKVFPAKIMIKYLPDKQPIIATHPLFGPDSVGRFGLKGQKALKTNFNFIISHIDPINQDSLWINNFSTLLVDLLLNLLFFPR